MVVKMFIITIPLKYIILDSLEHVDLSVVPEQEAIELITKSYGFLSSAVDVSIQNGIAFIRLKEQRAEKVSDALK